MPQTIVVIFTPEPNPTSQFFECLENFLDWSIPYQFEGIENPIAEFISKFCHKTQRQTFLELHDPIELHYMDREKALMYDFLNMTLQCMDAHNFLKHYTGYQLKTEIITFLWDN